MLKLFYSAQDVAEVLSEINVSDQKLFRLLDEIYRYEWAFIAPDYRQNKRKFILNTLYRIHCFNDESLSKSELASVRRDVERLGGEMPDKQYANNIDLFFKIARLKILYIDERKYMRIKLRTLLRKYGYKRRSRQIIQHINECMMFYHMQPAIEGNTLCKIKNVDIDKMMTLKII